MKKLHSLEGMRFRVFFHLWQTIYTDFCELFLLVKKIGWKQTCVKYLHSFLLYLPEKVLSLK